MSHPAHGIHAADFLDKASCKYSIQIDACIFRLKNTNPTVSHSIVDPQML